MATGDKFPVVMSRDRAVPGGVATLDETGILTAAQRPNLAQVGGSNRNLLDNWYFVNPINQLGQTEYTATGYTIDRWSFSTTPNNTTAVELTDNGLIVYNNDTVPIYLRQRFETPVPETCTISVLALNVIGSINLYAHYSNDTFSNYTILKNGVTSITIVGSAEKKVDRVQLKINAGDSACLLAAKIELGSVQTLARQNADGEWVLNDPPPNPALELAKCQRYQLVYPLVKDGILGIAIAQTQTRAKAFIFLPCATRALPSVKVDTSAIKLLDGGTVYEITSAAVYSRSMNCLTLNFISSDLTVGKTYMIVASAVTKFIIDANL